MVKVKFRYKDKLSHGNWNEQECRVRDLKECKKIYGLGIDEDCEYEIISVEEKNKIKGE